MVCLILSQSESHVGRQTSLICNKFLLSFVGHHSGKSHDNCVVFWLRKLFNANGGSDLC